jgi:hypothetical protein
MRSANIRECTGLEFREPDTGILWFECGKERGGESRFGAARLPLRLGSASRCRRYLFVTPSCTDNSRAVGHLAHLLAGVMSALFLHRAITALFESCSQGRVQSGESRIRTCGTRKGTTAFEAVAFVHSAISPNIAITGFRAWPCYSR